MKVETFTGAILHKMSGIGKCQAQFMSHIMALFLSIRGRLTYLNLGRYGSYCEQSYRINYEKAFDFKGFNAELISQYCGQERIWIFDPSYMSKSGKHTPGVGYFWSGCASAMKWGIELSALAIGDVENHTAMHYHATQTHKVKGEESLLSYYANLVVEQASGLQKMSKIVCVDAFFAKNSFVEPLHNAGFTVITRLQKNVYLRYPYTGEQRAGKGRPKAFDGKIDLKNVSTTHFRLIEENAEKRVYEGFAHVRCLKKWGKLVIVQYLRDDGTIKNTCAYFATDKEIPGTKVYEYYRMRYQIEFLFRDAKGHLGLEHSQSRSENAIHFHVNTALTTLNVAKAMHFLNKPKEQRNAFSIADIKTQYVNELILDRLISIYGKDPNVEKNNPLIRQLYQLGRIAA
jgi:hypothetical protein